MVASSRATSVDDDNALVLDLAQLSVDHVGAVGGKAANLGELIRAGFDVPPGFCVTTEAYRRAVRGTTVEAETSTDAPAARATVLGASFPEPVADAVRDAYARLESGAEGPVAVRSSATAEDLPGASFAGQQDTYLWIRGADEVLHHMRRCISSLYTGRAIAYRANKGFDDEGLAISVGVQKMANSYTAGVMFTIHPANGDRSVIVIDSNFGFGESVVSGEVTPDHFVVNKVTLDIIDRVISQKLVCYTVDPKSQVSRAIEVPFERQKVQSLIDDEITELAWMGKRIEKHYGRPMDIEWAVDKDLPAGGNIFVLQARPETVWSQRAQSTGVQATGSAMDYILSAMLAGKKVS
jgi:pyruvate, water dikinase